jgi:hypothetical protein
VKYVLEKSLSIQVSCSIKASSSNTVNIKEIKIQQATVVIILRWYSFPTCNSMETFLILLEIYTSHFKKDCNVCNITSKIQNKCLYFLAKCTSRPTPAFDKNMIHWSKNKNDVTYATILIILCCPAYITEILKDDSWLHTWHTLVNDYREALPMLT